jgi:transcriptional regulator with XRE-family HTH domain
MELADKLGVSQAAVSCWEQGKTEPRPAERTALEKITGPLRRNRSSKGLTSDIGEPHELPQNAGAFGAWLQRNRARADLSVPELAARAGVSAVAVYNIEAGKSINPRMETKRKLAKALKTDLPDDVQQEAADSQTIEGLGPLTDFDPHDEDDRPSRPGVYVFYDVSERPVYVGKAANIARRVADHADAFWFKYPIVANAA